MPDAHLLTPPRTATSHLHELLPDRVFAYLQPRGGWCVSNAGVLVGEDGVTLIDCTASTSSADHLKSLIASHTGRPVNQVVITHHHGDHHYGAARFPSTSVIAHEATRTAILRDGLDLPLVWPDADWGDIKIVPPTVTFDDRLTLHVDGLRVDLFHPGPAHTVGDIAAWLPEHGILFSGDLTFSSSTPFVLMGSVSGSIQALDRLRQLAPQIVVSGHGPVTGPEVIEQNAEYLRWVQQLALDGLAAGWDPLETAQRADLGAYAALPERERLVGNLHRAFAEHQGDAPGSRLPIPAIQADMVRYNGGRPLPCTL